MFLQTERIILKQDIPTEECFRYMEKLDFPFQYHPDFSQWEDSFLRDVDGEGRTLFSDLTTAGAYTDGALTGLIQYGRTAFGFDGDGAVSDQVHYPVIRQLYFDWGWEEAGRLLLRQAGWAFAGEERVYAFFHYFGMSCYARHGKLYAGFDHIHRALLEAGFGVEHKNVFYSSALSGADGPSADLRWHGMTAGRQRTCDFLFDGRTVGGCEVHFPEGGLAYLRWIFIEDSLCGKGLGTRCMAALKADLYRQGAVRLDTDTASTNTAAQRFYEKTGFVRMGVTRSYVSAAPGLNRQEV